LNKIWKCKIKSLYTNKTEQANIAREYLLKAMFGTSMSTQINLLVQELGRVRLFAG